MVNIIRMFWELAVRSTAREAMSSKAAVRYSAWSLNSGQENTPAEVRQQNIEHLP